MPCSRADSGTRDQSRVLFFSTAPHALSLCGTNAADNSGISWNYCVTTPEAARLAAAEILLSEQCFHESTAFLSAAIDATVTPRVEDLREGLRAGMEQAVTNTLQGFEHSLHDRVPARMEAVERVLTGSV